MYKEYFGLKELPFSIAPDPRYLYMSEQHREALAHLVYGINSDGGFVLLTGEVGTGKTTICRCLLDQLPENTDVAFILNPRLDVEELLAAFCDELHIGYPEGNASVKVFVDRVNAYLLDAHAKGRKTVLIIEEAQNLTGDVLEQIRLLTNLETNERKLLHLIMIGQPELRDMLAMPGLRQLSQRITARYHMSSLSKEETAAYVNHRLSVAGAKSSLFPPSTINKLFGVSRGIPRLINVICDRALLGAYVQGKESVDKRTLVKAAREALGQSERRIHAGARLKWAAAVLVLAVSAAAIYFGMRISDFGIRSGEIRPGDATASPNPQTAIAATPVSMPDIPQWPPGRPLIRPGQTGKAVQWLEKQLSIAQGFPVRQREKYAYDKTLIDRVKSFQISEGLVPDGIAGPQTIFRLINKMGSGEPLLTSKEENK